MLVVPAEGPPLRTEQDAVDTIAQTFMSPAEVVAIPVERLDPDFFVLSTGVAGAFVQKFVNYRKTLAVVGDVSAQVARSAPLADWVRESNRRTELWFVSDLEELSARLG